MDKHARKSPLATLRRAALAQDLPIGRALGALAVFLSAAVVGGASLAGSVRPFGLALVAAASGMPMLLAAAAGYALGALSGRAWAAAAVTTLLLAAARALCGARLAPQKEDPFRRRLWRGGATESVWLRMAFAAAAAMTEGALALLLPGSRGAPSLLAVFAAAVLTPLAALAFATRTEPSLSRTAARDAGTLTLLFAVTRALRDAVSLPFAAGAAFAFAASLAAARSAPHTPTARRIMGAAITGLTVGMAVDPGGAPVYAVAAVTAAAIWDFSGLAAVCAAWMAAVGLTFAAGGLAAFAAVMPEMTLAAAVMIPLLHFHLLPPLALRATASPPIPAAEAVRRAETAERQTAFSLGRLRALSASLHTMANFFDSVSARLRRPPAAALKSLCDEAMRRRCEGCAHRRLCWEREIASTSDMLARMSASLWRDGRVSAAVVPAPLAGRCHHMAEILDEINDGCAAETAEAVAGDRSDVFAEDFEAFSGLLTRCAEEAEEEFAPDEALSAKVRRALGAMDFYAADITVSGRRHRRVDARNLDLTRVRMGGDDLRQALEKTIGAHLGELSYRIDGDEVSLSAESVPFLAADAGSASLSAGQLRQERSGAPHGRTPPNGDCAVSFETDDGRAYLLLCDGMGTGGEASVTARMAAVFLSEMLCGGADMHSALSMLNNYMRSRRMEVSTGIDLMEIDRYTGEARFVKSGAAPSFVLRGGRLFRLASKTVPIGILRALDAEMIRFALEAGDVIVMLSDGVTENFEDSAWLCELLTSSVMEEAPGEIAARIVRAAAAGESGRTDDVTAAVVRISAAAG